MSVVYKTLSGDFPSGINETKLHEEIEAEVGITTTLMNITVDYPDTVMISFMVEPSVGELTTLDSLILVHDYTPSSTGGNIDNVGMGNETVYYSSTNSNTYVQVKRYIYNSKKKLNSIVLALWVDPGSTGDVRIVNCTNDMTVAELNGIINTDEEAFDMGVLSNLPMSKQQRLRIEMKVDAGFVYLSAVGNDYD